MKKVYFLSMLLAFLCLNLFSQVDKLSELPPIKKGIIMLSDGKKIEFKNLSSLNGNLNYFDLSGRQQQNEGEQVYKVVKVGTYALEGAIYSGLGGLLGALAGTAGWDEAGIGDKKGGFIIGATIISTALGGIIGALIPKEKIMYKNTNIDFSYMKHQFLKENLMAPTIGLKIKI